MSVANLQNRTRLANRSAFRRLVIESLDTRNVLAASALALMQAGDTAAQAVAGADFVTAIYADVLKRDPDPVGLNLFTNLINTGTPPSSVVEIIWNSAEHRGVEVDQAYRTLLQREADPVGRQAWVNALLGGMSEETLTASFMATPEYQQLHPLTRDFVVGVFNDLVHHDPDPATLDVLASALENNITTPFEVAQSVQGSQERHEILVTSFYTDFLLRTPTNDDGLQIWVAQLDAGVQSQTVAKAFLSSPEYVGLHPLPPPIALPGTGFVTALYANVLKRVPDPVGLNLFTNLLAAGTPPATVVDIIWNSAEHRGVEVDQAYRTLLQREADPVGRQNWVNAMLDGMSEEVLTSSFMATAEYQAIHPLTPTPHDFVVGVFNDLVHHDPDPATLDVLVSALQNNITTPFEVAQSVQGSQERHRILVTSFYTDFLLRAPNEDGLQIWVAQLDAGVASQTVAKAFLSSAEYVSLHPLPSPKIVAQGAID